TTFKGFDAAGNPTIVIEPHGATYTTVYDSMNRPILETDPLGVVTKREYNNRGALARVVDDFTPTPSAGLNVVSAFETNLYGQIERERVGFGNAQAGDVRGMDYFYDINRNLARTTDVLGNSATYTYDDADQQISSTDALGNVTRYTYDERGLLASTTYPGGAVDRFVYDGFGRLVTETIDAGGLDLTTTYAYDANSNIIQTTDASGTATCHTYDAWDRLVRTRRDCGGLDLTTTFVYDLAGRLVKQTDPRGVVSVFAYDDVDRQTLRRYDDGGLKIESHSTYAANGDLLSLTDGRGTQTVFTYDPLSRLRTQTVDPGGLALVNERRYDALGRLVAGVDANGETANFAVNAFGETIRETDPLGHVTSYTYDGAGNLLTATDPTGMTLRHRYDAAYRRVGLVNALGQQAQYEYDGRGNLVGEIDPNGNATAYTYDGGQRRIRQTDALSNTTTFAYDGMGRLLSETEPLGTIHTFAYDPLGRLIEETNPLGERMRHAYDGADNRIRTVAAIPAGGAEKDGQLTQFEYDGVSRLTRQIDPLGNATAYEYDAVGNRTATVDPLGRRTAFAYDPANRLVTVTDALNQSATYTYDAKGQIVSTTYANGDLLTFTYDAAGREAGVSFPDSTAIARTFDAAGRLTQATDPATDIRLGYDAVGRLTTVDDRRMQKTIRYAYDGTGNRTQLIGPDGLTTRYTYDALDRLTQVVQGSQQIGLTYDANSRLVGQQMGDGVRMQIDYDAAGRSVGMGYRGAGGAVLDQLTYTYDAAGNRTRIAYANGDVLAYTYDDANRLTGEQRTGGVSYSQTFAYDAADNRTRLVRDGTTTTYQYNAANQLTQSSGGQNQTYTYDARSRLVGMSGDVNRTYAYNFRDEMTAATGPDGNAAYGYDALRRRVSETVGGVTTNFLHDGVGVGTTVLAEYTPAGVLKTGYTLAPFTDGRLARSGSDGAGYYLTDGTGSTRYLADNSGGLVNRYEYDAFGQSTARQESLGNPYQFAGRRWDPTADLYDNRARRYSPSLGRFVQADPLGQVEGPNLYRYAQNNPVTRVDPLGWSSTDCLSIQKESDDLLGLEKYTQRISSLLKGLPSAPSITAKGTLKAQAKVCNKCCKNPAGGDCPDCPRKDYVGSASVSASAGIAITWPLASIGYQIRSYSFKFGVEAYGKLGVTIAGGGELNYCSGQKSIKLCGTGSVAGGVKAGLLEWPFKRVKLKAYVYGELKGSCSVCIGYSLTRGVSLYSAKCQACAEIGYKVEVTFFADWVSYSREDIFAKGCIGG
ncbi:MAG: RHS repeat-associated core domain-containing protein, partial [Caldilineaceae bacterium]